MKPFTAVIDADMVKKLADAGPPPFGAKVIFAGRDETLTRDLTAAFRLDFNDKPVFVFAFGPHMFQFALTPEVGRPGICLRLSLRDNHDVEVWPTLVTTDPRDNEDWQCNEWKAQPVIDACESFFFRRIIPTGVVQ
jgi:hypothetical protein